MKTKILCILYICTAWRSLAQEKGMKDFSKVVTDKFPTTRTFDIQHEQLGPSHFDSKIFGNDFESGGLESHNRLKIAFNMPFFVSDSKRFILTSSFRYKYETYSFGEIYNKPSGFLYTRNQQDFHYLAVAVSATYISTLFKKPIIYIATATADGNQKSIQRVKGFVTANLVLKRTQNTTITLGALVMLNPSSIIPMTPLFSYNHKFENSKWDIDFILPQRLLLRRQLLENGRISLGTELNAENFYLDLNNSNLKGTYELNQLELKSGITYEYRITTKVNTFLKGGINNVISARITARGEKTNNFVYDQKEDPQAYVRFGISFNPF